MARVTWDSVILTIIVGLVVIAFLPHSIHSISAICKDANSDLYIYKVINYSIMSAHISFFVSCLLIFIAYIILLLDVNNMNPSGDNQISRTIRALSSTTCRIGLTFIYLVFAIKLKTSFRNSMFAISKCTEYMLHILNFIQIPTSLIISVIIIINSDAKVATYLAMAQGSIQFILSIIMACIFCSKLSKLFVATGNCKNKDVPENNIAATQINLDLIPIMSQYSLLLIVLTLTYIFSVGFALSIRDWDYENETFYYYTVIVISYYIYSLCMYLTSNFAISFYNKICGVGD
eukprot:20435_1